MVPLSSWPVTGSSAPASRRPRGCRDAQRALDEGGQVPSVVPPSATSRRRRRSLRSGSSRPSPRRAGSRGPWVRLEVGEDVREGAAVPADEPEAAVKPPSERTRSRSREVAVARSRPRGSRSRSGPRWFGSRRRASRRVCACRGADGPEALRFPPWWPRWSPGRWSGSDGIVMSPAPRRVDLEVLVRLEAWTTKPVAGSWSRFEGLTENDAVARVHLLPRRVAEDEEPSP